MLARRATHEEIGMVLGIHLNTLRRHHKELLRTCFEETNNAMWHSLYEQGIGIPGKPARGKELAQPATPPNVKATIAWLKFKGGAVEEIRTVVAGDEKRPLRVRVELVG